MSRDEAWLLDMLQAARQALSYVRGLTEADFLSRPMEQDAVLRQLLIVGEVAKRLPEPFKTRHPEIPWKAVAGFRDVVVHDYADIDAKEVWKILQTDIPPLIAFLSSSVPPPP